MTTTQYEKGNLYQLPIADLRPDPEAFLTLLQKQISQKSPHWPTFLTQRRRHPGLFDA